MQFRSAFVALTAGAFAASCVSANIITDISVPQDITKGETFNVTFITEGALSGPRYFWAQYGLLTFHEHPDSMLGTLISGTNLVDLGKSFTVDKNFNVAVTVPKDGAFEETTGRRLFTVALYGVSSALNSPHYILRNQTVMVA